MIFTGMIPILFRKKEFTINSHNINFRCMEVNNMQENEKLFLEGKKIFAAGHPKQSIELFTQAEIGGYNPVHVYLNRGAAYLALGELDESIRDFTRVLDCDTDNERAYYYRGVTHLKKGEYEEAIADLSQSISRNKDRGAAFFTRGLTHVKLNHKDESLQDLKTAVALSNQEVERFTNQFGGNSTMSDKSMVLREGELGPWAKVLNEEEMERLKKWMEY
jgi:tetratricopeptide (TPR) repeat protein